jgi:diguanylate cyclase
MRLVMGQRIISLEDTLSQTQDQLESLAMFDPLTGILNQAAFNKLARGELERARRASSALSIIAMDVDNFKTLRDSYGAEAGESILKTVAENIREHSRSYDCIGHWTGPQFIIALMNVSDQEAEKIARRIITGIRFADVRLEGTVLDLSISAGITTVSKVSESIDIESLIGQAQQALAEAKKSGGYQVHLTSI